MDFVVVVVLIFVGWGLFLFFFFSMECAISWSCLHELCEVSEKSGVISVSQVCQYL